MKKLVSLMLVLFIAMIAAGALAGGGAARGVRSNEPAGSIDYEYDNMNSALVITGSGSIPDYGSGDATPWAGYRSQAKRIVIEENVSGIGAYAFAGFTDPDLRVEFLQSSKPTISDTAFAGTTAVCRYYVENWATDAGLTWIYLPLFSDQFFNNPPVLCYDGKWFFYDASHGNSNVYITEKQAIEYTYSGQRSLYLYAVPDADDEVIKGRWDDVLSVGFLGCSGSLTIDFTNSSVLRYIDVSSSNISVTMNDPRREGAGNVRVSGGTLIYNGNMHEITLEQSFNDEGHVTINGNLDSLQYSSLDSKYPYKGDLTVSGSVASGIIYGDQTLTIPGVGDVHFQGTSSQTFKESISQTEPIIKNSQLNLTEENQKKLVGNVPKLEDYGFRYQFINNAVMFELRPKDHSIGTDIGNVFDYNKDFTLDDIIYGEDTEICIFEKWNSTMVFNGKTVDGKKLGIGSVLIGPDCDAVLNCPVNDLRISYPFYKTEKTDLTINDRVNDCTITTNSPAVTLKLGENGNIVNGRWERALRGVRFFESARGACDLFTDGSLNVMSHKSGESMQAILPSDNEVSDAAGQDATVDVKESSLNDLNSKEDAALDDFLEGSGGTPTAVLDVSVTGYSVDGNGNATAGENISELKSAIPLVVSNPVADGNSEDEYAYVLRLHENDGEGVAADPMCDATSKDELEFESDKFSKYVVVKTKIKGHVHKFTYAAAGATITATCDQRGCKLSGNKVTLTIVPPAKTAYGDNNSAKATLKGLEAFNAATGQSVAATDIKYVGRGAINYAESANAPENAGTYTAKITAQGNTAQVDYEIAPRSIAGAAVTLSATQLPYNGATQTVSIASVVLGDNTKLAAGDYDVTGNTGVEVGAYTVTITGKGNHTGSVSADWAIVKANVEISTVPKAKIGLVYTGSAQALIEAGSVAGGTMQYALGNDAVTAPAEGWGEAIPTGTDAGDYYVWYKAVGDANHVDSEPAQVTATIHPVDRETLNAAIASARKYYDTIKGKTDYKKIASTLKAAIDAAQAVANNENAQDSDIAGAITAVTTAAASAAETQAVVDAINALPTKAGAADKKVVKAARAAYDALTKDQKAQISEKVLKKLTTAEKQVKEATETVKISKCKITVKDLTYTGKTLKPKVTVKYGKTTLKEGTHYTLSYSKKIKAIGPWTVTVKGKGKYTGSKKLSFNVIPKGTAFTKLTGGKKQITLKWKNPKNITGYQIEYSLKKNFSGGKKVTIKKAKTLTTTIKKLKAGKTYYVRMRTYTTVKKKNYYSTWSAVKTVKTKGTGKKSNEPEEQVFEITMKVGETFELKAFLSPEASETEKTWTTSDAEIVAVSEDGVATALLPGKATITATGGEGELITIVVNVGAEEIGETLEEGIVLLDLEGIDDTFTEIDGDLNMEMEIDLQGE